MKKKVGIILITFLVLLYIFPLFVHMGVSITSPFGFISNEKQDVTKLQGMIKKILRDKNDYKN